MNVEKRDIILKEIQYWRRTKLLPEQYCDFLTNLYSDEGEVPNSNPITLQNLQQGNIKIWMFAFGIISLILLIGFYFSVFPWGLQLATAVSLLVVCYGYAGLLRNRMPIIGLSLAGIGSFLTLGFGLWMIFLHNLEDGLSIPIFVGVCGLLWIILGFTLRIGLLHFGGYGALCLLYAGFAGRVRPEAGVWELQLLWLPLCVLMIWLSWLLYHRVKGVSGVYFGVGALLWLMPEIDSLLLRRDYPAWLSLLLIGKIAAELTLLFLFRKKWIAWVAT
ncbi:hypothetical protein G5B47_05190 [Paenibacillus sp. 7124]|uniref:DUF2157 domain-containing protein n=1 Tax=Paenibacillus apii TaxID=1850370 RepID=A0A6M1PEN5_9BACL|nr:hypothetical protein [Paenibacillus apii]NGM81800.1 hypothetical protein [Paenibacillus apii]NJJ41041.1 hypothetical protein [Paenibacillus apii]